MTAAAVVRYIRVRETPPTQFYILLLLLYFFSRKDLLSTPLGWRDC